ncbi:hypothetical protein GCM10022381_38800 [Leifsonia kafniensis]|uniref:Iron ABC transporter ATP-binding protein n=1 Tax=Leifsonia kafniensis TaxID=475957 RepID=A0ABP7L1Q4_9MICO
MPALVTSPRIRPSVSRNSRRRVAAPLAAGLLVLLALTACSTDSPKPGSSTTPSAGATAPAPGATDAPGETPTPTPTPEAIGTPVALTCDQILTPDDVYAYNPNYGVAPDFEPTSAAAQTAVKYDGVACGWLNQTSDATFEVSVTQPNDVLQATLIDQALLGGKAVPTYGTTPIEGFFASSGGVGTAQVLSGAHWVSVSSTEFAEPGDAQTLVASVLSHLG